MHFEHVSRLLENGFTPLVPDSHYEYPLPNGCGWIIVGITEYSGADVEIEVCGNVKIMFGDITAGSAANAAILIAKAFYEAESQVERYTKPSPAQQEEVDNA